MKPNCRSKFLNQDFVAPYWDLPLNLQENQEERTYFFLVLLACQAGILENLRNAMRDKQKFGARECTAAIDPVERAPDNARSADITAR